MKRKLLLAFAISALLMLVFAISIFAAEIPEWTEITEVDGMPDKSLFGTDGTKGATSRVLMSDGITYPAYYICKNSTSLGFSYSDLSSKSGKTYAAKDVVRLEVPNGVISTPSTALKTENGYTSLLTVSLPEGFTTLGEYTFKGTDSVPSALVSVSLPSTLKTIGQYAFVRCAALEELVIPEGVTSIPKEMASYTSSLKKVVLPSTITSIGELAFRTSNLSEGIVIPEGCTTLSNYAFKESGITTIYLPSTLETVGNDICYGCKSITTVDSKSPIIGYRMFYDCDSLTSITLENTIEIREQGFNNPNGGILNITELVLPEGLTTIGNYAFTRAKITELVLPSTLTNIGKYVFQASTTLQKIVVLGSVLGEGMFMNCSAVNELVLTENFVTLSKDALSNVSQTSFLTYYTGTDIDRIKTVCSSTTRVSQAKFYTYEDYTNDNYTYNKFMVIYDCNLCDVAFDGIHTNPGDDGDCTTALICSMCNEYTIREALSHISSERLTYTSFMKEGEYYVGCTNEGCEHGSAEKLEALFTCLGYSTPEYEGGAVALGYFVNHKAIERYEELSGNTVKYGLYAAIKDTLGDNDIIDSKGNASAGAIKAGFENSAYSNLFIKMFGFGDKKDAEFTIGAYVEIVNDGASEYSYLQIGEPKEGEKYAFIKYSNFVSQ
ncbi:MAG: leucine-rich repeat protein [Clostridia bacterium]|nr:leucine-rich repeat protein [Clostridia bacterium]